MAELGGVRCKVYATKICEEQTGAEAGTVVKADKKGLKIACGSGTVLEICELQPDGKKRMPANAFLLGRPIPEGSSVR